jgi:hypothetical protein
MIINSEIEQLVAEIKEFLLTVTVIIVLLGTGFFIGRVYTMNDIVETLKNKQYPCRATITISKVESAEWDGVTTLDIKKIFIDNFGNFWYDGI